MEGMASYVFLRNSLLTPLLVVICIPLYLCFIRPHISYYIPGMLKRVGLGIVLVILSLVISLAMDLVVHAMGTGVLCMFSGITHLGEFTFLLGNSSSMMPPLYQNLYFFLSQQFLSTC